MSLSYCARHGQEASFDVNETVYDRETQAHLRFYHAVSMQNFGTSYMRFNKRVFGPIIQDAGLRPVIFLDRVFFWRELTHVVKKYRQNSQNDNFKYFMVRFGDDVGLAVRYDPANDHAAFDKERVAREMLDAKIVGFASQLSIYTYIQGREHGLRSGIELVDGMATHAEKLAWFRLHARLSALFPASWTVDAVLRPADDDADVFTDEDDGEDCVYVVVLKDGFTNQRIFPVGV